MGRTKLPQLFWSVTNCFCLRGLRKSCLQEVGEPETWGNMRILNFESFWTTNTPNIDDYKWYNLYLFFKIL